ncbi:MAG: 50S ribosomal protein L21e [Methanobacteriota archaeon]|nr:MAG: 50S ribosomal protein L21e [Euryarchaeota archaeon]
MAVRSRGQRSKTRSKMRKKIREKGSVPITRAMQSFAEGDVVHIVIDPAYHKGAPHPKWHGKTGHVIGRRGRSYLVRIRDQDSHKTVIANPVHLRETGR